MKKILLVFFLTLLGCSFPVQVTLGTPARTPTLEATPRPSASPWETQTPPAPPEIGTDQNPLILALAPSLRPSDEMIAAGESIAAFIQSRTGYRVVTVVPASEQALVEAFSKNNAHIASLSPYGYVFVREDNTAVALLARVRDGQAFYGTQIIANRKNDFISYYDAVRDENTAEAASALRQFDQKKACWSDEVSPSGYVVPLGLLNQAKVQIRGGAFLGGQPSVVRAVYADDICDFGATFVDARNSPALEADYPDVLDRVIVVWRVPNIIPYENISIATSLPFEMRRVIQRAFIDLMLTTDGKSAMQTVYGIDALQVVEDAAYAEFAAYVKAAGLERPTLIK
ncbi:MAG: PhnD/SsuA/transferrin family substrate-binding protein [Anaerolineales bacterium]|nr:MAG: PhnD/SsuA/transferrin family substrate-binding protein [Anaerolineales bacterium]